MKTIFTFLLAAMATLSAHATDYKEPIVVVVNGVSAEQTGTISVTETNEGYDLTLKNFVLNSADGNMGVGNIEMKGIKAYEDGNATLLTTSQTITITEGDAPDVPFWMATMLPPVPVELRGKIEDGHLRCFIDIDLQATMQQTIQVAVGSGYQLRNQSFEDWHTSADSYVEPHGWHSFESATGMLAALAGHHIEKSGDAHSGETSARIFATSLFGIIANGTMTTGRMNAGAAVADDTNNNAYLDMSLDATDGHGDPFYTPLVSRPDSIAFWVKFRQGTPNADHPYATMSAIITDGTYYQDPEDKEYSNVVAKAKNNTIAQTNGEWVRIVTPFSYTDADVLPKAILVTLSTNADAGQGSKDDELLIDDSELIYNAALANLQVKGQDVPAFSTDVADYEMTVNEAVTADDITAVATSRSAHIMKTVEHSDYGYLCTITVFGGDMAKTATYTVKVKSSATAISDVKAATRQHADCYTLDGRRAATLSEGNVYVRRMSDGTVRKVLR